MKYAALGLMCFAACHSSNPSSATDAQLTDAPSAPRCDTTQDFVVASPVAVQADFGMTSITGDNLTALSLGSAGMAIATRASTSNEFPAGTALDTINSSGVIDAAAITPDGLTLYYVQVNGLYVAQRASATVAFGGGGNVPFSIGNRVDRLALSRAHVFYESDGVWYSAPLATDGTISAAPSQIPTSTDPPTPTNASPSPQIPSYDEREWYTDRVYSNAGGGEVYRWGAEGTGVFVSGSLSLMNDLLAVSPDDCDFYYSSNDDGPTTTMFVVSRPPL